MADEKISGLPAGQPISDGDKMVVTQDVGGNLESRAVTGQDLKDYIGEPSGVVPVEPFVNPLVFDKDQLQITTQTGDLTLDIAGTGHATEGQIALAQEVGGNGANVLTGTPDFLSRLKGDSLSNAHLNRLFYVYTPSFSGNVYEKTEIFNSRISLPNPVIFSSMISNAERNIIYVTFNEVVTVTAITNTVLTTDSGLTLTGTITGSGTDTIGYELSGDASQTDTFSLTFNAPSDVVALDDSSPLLVPVTTNVTNNVVDSSYPDLATLQGLWDGFSGVTESGSASVWTDQKNSHDLVEDTVSKQPTYNAMDADFNNQPTLSFDGIDDMLRCTTIGASLSSSDKITIYLVGKIKSIGVPPPSVYRTIFTHGNPGTDVGALYGRYNNSVYRIFIAGDVGSSNSSQINANPDLSNEEIVLMKFVVDFAQPAALESLIQVNDVDGTQAGTQNNTNNVGNLPFNLGAYVGVNGDRFGHLDVAHLSVHNGLVAAPDDTAIKSYLNTTYGV